MPRNSLMPLILLVLTAVFAAWMVRGAAARGQDGPDNQQGIFRLPAKESRRVVPATVPATTNVSGELPALGDGMVVQIVGGDRHGLTRSICRSLAELLTERGLIAVMEPVELPGKENEPVPLPCDGSLRIATDRMDPPEAPGLPYRATVTVTATPVRLPAGHPALRLFPQDAVTSAAPATVTITLDVAALADASWPTWWSGVGRAAATAIATSAHLPTTGDAGAHIRRGAWMAPVQAAGPAGEERPMTEHGRLPSPPQHDVVDGMVPFSHPLVRGWVGRLGTQQIQTHEGGQRSPAAELERRLTKGQWLPSPAVAGRKIFSREAEGMTTVLSMDEDGALVVWQERPSPVTVVKAWLEDPAAAAQLARHRGIAGLPTGIIP